MRQLSPKVKVLAEADVVCIIQAMQVLFGEEKVRRFTLVESLCSDGNSPLPLALVMGALVRSEFREVVMKTIAGG